MKPQGHLLQKHVKVRCAFGQWLRGTRFTHGDEFDPGPNFGAFHRGPCGRRLIRGA